MWDRRGWEAGGTHSILGNVQAAGSGGWCCRQGSETRTQSQAASIQGKCLKKQNKTKQRKHSCGFLACCLLPHMAFWGLEQHICVSLEMLQLSPRVWMKGRINDERCDSMLLLKGFLSLTMATHSYFNHSGANIHTPHTSNVFFTSAHIWGEMWIWGAWKWSDPTITSPRVKRRETRGSSFSAAPGCCCQQQVFVKDGWKDKIGKADWDTEIFKQCPWEAPAWLLHPNTGAHPQQDELHEWGQETFLCGNCV